MSDKQSIAWLSSQNLTKNQETMLKWMCVLIVIQWVLLFTIVQIIHYSNPNLVNINLLVAILLPIVLLIMIFLYSIIPTPIRVMAFLGLGVVMSYILSAEYNMTILRTPPQQRDRVRRSFLIIWVGVIVFFGLVVGLLPYLLPHAPLLGILGVVLFIILIGLLISLFFVPPAGRGFTIWLYVSVAVFMLLIITDTVSVIIRCETEGSRECDPVIGATDVYLDMINLLINAFRLANEDN